MNIPIHMIKENDIKNINFDNIENGFYVSKDLTESEKRSKTVSLSYSTNINLFESPTLRDMIMKATKSIKNETYYHGKFKRNDGNSVHLVTINASNGFNKCLVEMTDNEFEEFFGKSPVSQAGGKFLSTENKYKIYKQKCKFLESLLQNKD